MNRFFMAVLALALAAPAGAVNINVFKDAPITRLNSEELKAFRGVVGKALDEAPDGATVEWKAPKTQFVSKITPQKSFTEGALKCRDATIESEARDSLKPELLQRGRYTFCKGAKGDWQFKLPAAQAKSK